MKIEGVYHPDALVLLPMVQFQAAAVECDNCDEDNGFGIVLGWFFWSCIFFFPKSHHHL